MKMFIIVILVIGLVISVRTRQKALQWRSPSGTLAKAITQLVGTAGGIYLSLELLLTFLGIPESIWNPVIFYYIKPLAVFSLFLAVLQPYVEKILIKIQKRRSL